MSIDLKSPLLRTLIVLILAAAIGCDRRGVRVATNSDKISQVWHDTYEISVGLEKYYQRNHSLPTTFSEIAQYLDPDVKAKCLNERWVVHWNKVNVTQAKPSDPEVPFVRVCISVEADGTTVSENYDLLSRNE